MDDSIKRWTAKRKTALVIEIIQGKTTVSEASRSFDLTPSEIEGWVEDAKRGMENSLRANPLDIREQYEKQLRDLQEAYSPAHGLLQTGESRAEGRSPLCRADQEDDRNHPVLTALQFQAASLRDVSVA
ncbi:DUF1153 domain-containing protein [Mangrovicoccus algicola]|uniref:DUF1153 domain-containing protein n=2 Tax=Paracoccaceae TaxID=31989 RepID=UPI001D01B667|nr:DUF1153 domain-containing protein [Mangrovicoccus algicola]